MCNYSLFKNKTVQRTLLYSKDRICACLSIAVRINWTKIATQVAKKHGEINCKSNADTTTASEIQLESSSSFIRVVVRKPPLTQPHMNLSQPKGYSAGHFFISALTHKK